MNWLHHILAFLPFLLFGSFDLGGSASTTDENSLQETLETAGATSPVNSGAGAVSGTGKSLTGSNDNSGATAPVVSGAGSKVVEGSDVGGNQTTTYNGLDGSDVIGLLDAVQGNAGAATEAAASTPSPIAEEPLVIGSGGGTIGLTGGASNDATGFLSGIDWTAVLPWLALALPGGLLIFWLLKRKKS